MAKNYSGSLTGNPQGVVKATPWPGISSGGIYNALLLLGHEQNTGRSNNPGVEKHV